MLNLILFRIDTTEAPPAFVVAKTSEKAVEIYVSAETDRGRELADFEVERWDAKVAAEGRQSLQVVLSGWETGLVTYDALKGGWSLMPSD